MLIRSPLLDSIVKPDRKPPTSKAEIILFNASITITKRKGDNGSLCLMPRELLKMPNKVPFTKTEKHTEEI
jgi:hypothetical protein